MTVVQVSERRGARGSTEDRKGNVTLRREFLVRSDSRSESDTAIKAHASIPQSGEGHPDNPSALLATREVRQRSDNAYYYDVHCSFSSEQSEDDRTEGDDPLLDRPEIYTDSVTFTRPFLVDIRGKPVTNSAGQPFDPPYEVDDSRPVLVITRNQPTLDVDVADSYRDAINVDAFSIIDQGFSFFALPGHVKMESVRGERLFRTGTYYWRVTYRLHINRKGFRLLLLDEGTVAAVGAQGFHGDVSHSFPDAPNTPANETNVGDFLTGVANGFAAIDQEKIDAGHPPVTVMTDDRGHPVAGSFLLDGHGKPLQGGQPAVFLPFHAYDELLFGPLQLPFNLVA